MSNLSRRVLKAKEELRITKTGRCYHTWDSQNDHYEICLSSSRKDIVTPDGYLSVPVFHSSCNNVDKNCACQGNSLHAVCYHSLGAIFRSFDSVDSHVSFYETYHAAVNGLNLGGYIAKIVNNNGRGHTWCVVRKEGQKRQEMKFKVMPDEK